MPDEKPKVQHVRMERTKPAFPGGPITADVHPDEVVGYEEGGWHRAAPPAPSVAKTAK